MSMRRSPELRPTVWDGLTALAVLLLALGPRRPVGAWVLEGWPSSSGGAAERAGS